MAEHSVDREGRDGDGEGDGRAVAREVKLRHAFGELAWGNV